MKYESLRTELGGHQHVSELARRHLRNSVASAVMDISRCTHGPADFIGANRFPDQMLPKLPSLIDAEPCAS